MASNPRTAIGVIGDLHYLFVVADGRTSESEGLSLYELAQITKKNIYTYGVVVLFCIFGTKIYEQFSYGEYSLYMRSMFWFLLQEAWHSQCFFINWSGL